MSNHHPSTSISRARLTQSLPPLPGEDAVPIEPYHDDPADDEDTEDGEGMEGNQTDMNEPPGYEPMHDYLVSRVRRLAQMRPPEYALSSQDHTHDIPLQHQEPYRDDPFIITIDPNQPPPPSYEALYIQTQRELEILNEEIDPDISHAEDVCKWLNGPIERRRSYSSEVREDKSGIIPGLWKRKRKWELGVWSLEFEIYSLSKIWK
ncbi:hypothetical protein BofuT4_P030370.1 [Botrytis cinerea T4]|uniref:Uncharacterized protein n=1 Tax=Botryotinia fuckeliana (strain T4) TaxID=999810 RepID=G2Y985_BOTF4|nr:hypothetical protein BofuT4_P030370.1 [Botrytis cinerea T4]